MSQRHGGHWNCSFIWTLAFFLLIFHRYQLLFPSFLLSFFLVLTCSVIYFPVCSSQYLIVRVNTFLPIQNFFYESSGLQKKHNGLVVLSNGVNYLHTYAGREFEFFKVMTLMPEKGAIFCSVISYAWIHLGLASCFRGE